MLPLEVLANIFFIFLFMQEHAVLPVFWKLNQKILVDFDNFTAQAAM
jgi:hypothetical protein